MLQQTEGLKVLTDSLRSKHGLDWRNGIVEDRRFEFFRGKDFAVYFKEHPEKFDSWIPDKSGRSKVLCSALFLYCTNFMQLLHCVTRIAAQVSFQVMLMPRSRPSPSCCCGGASSFALTVYTRRQNLAKSVLPNGQKSCCL